MAGMNVKVRGKCCSHSLKIKEIIGISLTRFADIDGRYATRIFRAGMVMRCGFVMLFMLMRI